MAMDPNSFASFADAFDHWAKVHSGWSGWWGKGTTWKFGKWKWTRTRGDMECLRGVPWILCGDWWQRELVMAAAAGNISGGGQSCRRAFGGGFPPAFGRGITDDWQLCYFKRRRKPIRPFMQYGCWNMLNSEFTCFWNWMVRLQLHWISVSSQHMRRALWMWRPSCHEGAACGSRLQWVWFVVACPLCGWVANSPKDERRS